MKYKISKIVVIVTAFILSSILYFSEYNIGNNTQSIEESISSFIGEEVTVRDTKKVENILLVYFTIDSCREMGITPMYRGINGLYQIRGANYGGEALGVSVYGVEGKEKDLLVVYGENTDMMINTINVKHKDKEYNLDSKDKKYIVDAFMVDNYNFFDTELNIYDSNGNDINEDLIKKRSGIRQGGTGVGKAELFILDVLIGLIFFIAFFIILGMNKSEVERNGLNKPYNLEKYNMNIIFTIDDYKHFNKLFWGFLIVLIDLRFPMIDILPDFIGYLFIYFGVKGLSAKDKYLKKAKTAVIFLFFISFIGVFFYFENKNNFNQIIALVFLIIDLFFMYFICKGISNLGKRRSLIYLVKCANKRFIYYFVLQIIVALYMLFGSYIYPITSFEGISHVIFMAAFMGYIWIIDLVNEAGKLLIGKSKIEGVEHL